MIGEFTATGPLAGQTLFLVGRMHGVTRRRLEQLVRLRGAKLATKPSARVTVIAVGHSAASDALPDGRVRMPTGLPYIGAADQRSGAAPPAGAGAAAGSDRTQSRRGRSRAHRRPDPDPPRLPRPVRRAGAGGRALLLPRPGGRARSRPAAGARHRAAPHPGSLDRAAPARQPSRGDAAGGGPERRIAARAVGPAGGAERPVQHAARAAGAQPRRRGRRGRGSGRAQRPHHRRDALRHRPARGFERPGHPLQPRQRVRRPGPRGRCQDRLADRGRARSGVRGGVVQPRHRRGGRRPRRPRHRRIPPRRCRPSRTMPTPSSISACC